MAGRGNVNLRQGEHEGWATKKIRPGPKAGAETTPVPDTLQPMMS
jgi:hypothetical protein